MPYVAKLSGGCTADPAISVGLQGGDGIWSTTVANWNTAADGSGQRVAWTNGDDAIISAGNTGTITISGGVTANSVTFTNGGYTVNGSTLALTGTRAIVSNGDSSNYTIVCSEIMSDVTFNGNAVYRGNGNEGIFGNATFNDSSVNQGTITGNATFNGSSFNDYGPISGNVTFNDSSYNNGTISGDATFNGFSYNIWGTINGDATFNGFSYNNWGTINGDATFNTAWYDPTGNTAPSDGVFVVSGSQYWYGSVSGTVYGIDGQAITSYVFDD